MWVQTVKELMLVEEAFDCWLSGKAGNTEDYGKWFYQTIGEAATDHQMAERAKMGRI